MSVSQCRCCADNHRPCTIGRSGRPSITSVEGASPTIAEGPVAALAAPVLGLDRKVEYNKLSASNPIAIRYRKITWLSLAVISRVFSQDTRPQAGRPAEVGATQGVQCGWKV